MPTDTGTTATAAHVETTGSDAETPVGDPQAFTRLRKWGGEGLVRNLVGLFRELVPKRTAIFRQALLDGDPREAEAAAHALKSSCGQLGALRMLALCQRMEMLAAAGEIAPLPGLVQDLEGEFARYLEWLPQVLHATRTNS
ncbi:hypothetical protein BH20GEM2_BH20GEM2_04650 [soil metagenome]